MTIFEQYKEKLKGFGGRKACVKSRRNYEDLERYCDSDRINQLFQLKLIISTNRLIDNRPKPLIDY